VSDSPPHTSLTPSSLQQKRTLLLWLFPIAIWAVSTGFLGFGLGKYSDDWSQSFINPQTGHADAAFHPWVRWHFFFRPLYFIVVWAINTAFWEHDAARHLIAALCHLAVGICLFRLLRRIGLNRPASIVPVSVFLACPTHYEAVFWVAAIGIPIGSALFLIAAARVVDFSRQIPDRRPWWRLAAIFLLIFSAACFHEQPAAGAASLPALYLACCISNQPFFIRLRRAMLVGISGGLACIFYTALITLTAPAGRRGSLSSLVTGAHASDRLSNFTRDIRRWLIGDHARDAVIDAAERGLHIASSHTATFIFPPLLLAGLAAWFIAFPANWSRTLGNWTTRRTPWLFAFCAILAIASLVPVAMTASNGVYSRYFYVFGLGFPIACACLIDLLSGLRIPRSLRFALPCSVALVAAALTLWGSLAMISWQREFAARAAVDREIGARLLELVPNPPRNAVVIPIAISLPHTGTRSPDHSIPGVLERPHAGWAFIQHLYGRADVSATHCRAGEAAPIRLAPDGLTYVYPDGWNVGFRDEFGRPINGRAVVSWSEAIPIEIDAEAHVRILSREDVEKKLANRR
jgi:hypothetical protein